MTKKSKKKLSLWQYIKLGRLLWSLKNIIKELGMWDFLKSKKFWYAVAGVIAIIFSSVFGIPEDKIMEIAKIVIALIMGQGLADLGKHAK